jgi:hypothetical protein
MNMLAQTKLILAFIIFSTLITCLYTLTMAADDTQKYTGKSAPSLEVLQENIDRYGNQSTRGIRAIGINKENDNKYLIITNKGSDAWGGPYELLRLESGEWVMSAPGQLSAPFLFIMQ